MLCSKPGRPLRQPLPAAAAPSQRAIELLSGARTTGPVVFPELTHREREVLDLIAVSDRSALIVRAREAGLGRDPADPRP